jgi:hypothetical protein
MLVLFALFLAVDAAPAAPAAPVVEKPAQLRDAKVVLADYAKAIGSEDGWKKHKSLHIRREVTVKSMQFSSLEETWIARGGRIMSTSEMKGMGTFRRASDGHKAWAEDPIGGLRILKDGEAEDVRIAATWNVEWHLGEVYTKAVSVPAPEAAPKDQPLECVELAKTKGRPTILCFDGKTHLRVWEKGVQASQGGEVPYVTRFSDWRPVEGVLVWHKEHVTVGPVSMEGRIVEIVFDEPIPAALFTLPKKK